MISIFDIKKFEQNYQLQPPINMTTVKLWADIYQDIKYPGLVDILCLKRNYGKQVYGRLTIYKGINVVKCSICDVF